MNSNRFLIYPFSALRLLLLEYTQVNGKDITLKRPRSTILSTNGGTLRYDICAICSAFFWMETGQPTFFITLHDKLLVQIFFRIQLKI
jgi:hypothetical protein